MLGFDAVSEYAISEVYFPQTIAVAGTAKGEAFAQATGRHLGVFASAGHAVGVSFAQGLIFKLGTPAVRKNQPFDFSVNALQALLWQYNKAPVLTAILKAKQAWYDKNQTQFWEDFYTDIFDLRTANDFGCAVWSIILGLPLSIEYLASDGHNWGFDPYQNNFDRGNFAPGVLTPLPLTVEQKRLVLQLRYFQLITRGCPPQINKFLSRIFGAYGPAYVVDNLNMTMTYIFAFNLPAPLQFIFKFYDLLPAPAGVKVTFISNGQAQGTAVGAAVVSGVGHSRVAAHGTAVGAAIASGVT